MGKYITAATAGSSFGPGSAQCSGGPAQAFDEIDQACFKVFGTGIVIGDTSASIQGGFEVFNFNIHNDGTQCACVSNVQLEGPVNV